MVKVDVFDNMHIEKDECPSCGNKTLWHGYGSYVKYWKC